jgi:hypothetical protein
LTAGAVADACVQRRLRSAAFIDATFELADTHLRDLFTVNHFLTTSGAAADVGAALADLLATPGACRLD